MCRRRAWYFWQQREMQVPVQIRYQGEFRIEAVG